MNGNNILERLEIVIKERKIIDPNLSYVANLYNLGLDRILKKVGEEAIETIIAAKGDNRKQVIYETADLIFHLLVMLIQQEISLKEILSELERRFGLSGLDEKIQREKE